MFSGVTLVSILHVAAAPFTPRGDQDVLLFGEPTVAKTTNLQLTFYPARRHPANPVLRRSEPWEGVGPYIFGNRLMQDELTRELRLWYIAYRFQDNYYRWAYATSTNGLQWTKPDLGVEQFEGKPARNLLPLGPHPDKGTRSIARDPRPSTPPERRYLGVRFTYDGEFVSFSPDGIHWKEYAGNPAWHVPSDIISILWDDRRQKFVAFYKIWELKGREFVPGGPTNGQPFIAHMPTFTPKELGNGLADFEGPCVFFHAPAAATVEQRKFTLRSGKQSPDDGGGVSLSGEWNAKRVQAFAESADGMHWSNEQVVLRADEQDSPSSNIQYLFVMQYGGYYIGFATLHDVEGLFRLHLAWSADGLHWHRPTRVPWMDTGPANAFDYGMVLGPADPIFWEKEMWFPYGGFPIRHDSRETNWESAVGLAVMRRDGFAAWEASENPGELTTQPFVCNGDKLIINAEIGGWDVALQRPSPTDILGRDVALQRPSPDGSIVVEILDENSKVIRGFDAKACQPITGDTLAEPSMGRVHWGKSKELDSVRNKTIQLHFKIKNARLYSFRIATDAPVNLPVPRATRN